jgi:hypothetical protein
VYQHDGNHRHIFAQVRRPALGLLGIVLVALSLGMGLRVASALLAAALLLFWPFHQLGLSLLVRGVRVSEASCAVVGAALMCLAYALLGLSIGFAWRELRAGAGAPDYWPVYLGGTVGAVWGLLWVVAIARDAGEGAS